MDKEILVKERAVMLLVITALVAVFLGFWTKSWILGAISFPFYLFFGGLIMFPSKELPASEQVKREDLVLPKLERR